MVLSATTLRTQYLPGISESDTDSVTRLTAILARAEERVVSYLQYPLQSGGTIVSWASGTYVLRLSGQSNRKRRLALPVFPVTAVASVYQDATHAFAAASLVASSDYEQENLQNGAYLHLLPTSTVGAWLTGARDVKVTLTAGYANEAAIPTILADAVYRLATHRYQRAPTAHLESVSKNAMSESFGEDADIPKPIRDTLAAYRMLRAVGIS